MPATDDRQRSDHERGRARDPGDDQGEDQAEGTGDRQRKREPEADGGVADGPVHAAIVRGSRLGRRGLYDPGMTISDPKSTLVDGLGLLNEQVLHKLDGLSEYDLRRPMTPTGTNLLGLVKHLASVQAGYFGETFGRPFPEDLPFDDDDPQADMYARADEPSESVIAFYRASWRHALETFAERDLDSVGSVPWWSEPEVTLHQILVHMTNETARHAGHLDIVREMIDGDIGRSAGDSNIADGFDWPAYVEKLEAIARGDSSEN